MKHFQTTDNNLESDNSRGFVNPDYADDTQKQFTKRKKDVNAVKSNQFPSLAQFLVSYISLRTKQIQTSTGLFMQLIGSIVVNIKNFLVRKMYWGRTSFYKTAFHIIVIITTLFALLTGLDYRIITSQQETMAKNINVSDIQVIDSDLVYQQASLLPLSEIGETDSLYFEYTVKSGDTLDAIAKTNDILANTIRWANNIPEGRDNLSVGQVIKIPKTNGVLYKVKEGDTVEKVLNNEVKLKNKETDTLTFRELNADYILEGDKLKKDSQVLIPDATLKPKPKPKPTTSSGGSTTYSPQPATAPQAPPGKFVNPMQAAGGYGISRGYSYGHTGVDFTVPIGSWVVSAGAGTVTQAGWCYSLGYCVAVRHANGYQTIYGHGNGTIAVTRGQQVVAGQKIMQSGCTGLCFGPHVHMSLTANNNDVYSCYRCRINPRGIIPY